MSVQEKDTTRTLLKDIKYEETSNMKTFSNSSVTPYLKMNSNIKMTSNMKPTRDLKPASYKKITENMR